MIRLCRSRMMLANLLETEELAILTKPIVLEYLDALARPAVRTLTGLTGRQSVDLVTSLIFLSRQVQLRFSWPTP
jgi:hypothetical protein